MKKTLIGALLCGAIGAAVSGCNNSETPPIVSSAPAAPAAPAGAPGAPTAPNGQTIPANAPSGIQKQMQMMNRGGGGQMGRPGGGGPPGGYGGPSGYGRPSSYGGR
jgi:hypothetical protein